MARTAPVSRATLVLLGLLLLAASLHWRLLGDDGRAWRHAIGSDGEGYYAHLAMLLAPGDSTVGRLREHHVVPAGDGRVIKYAVGTPVMQAPFVLVAHAWRAVTGAPADARAVHYQCAIALASLAWSIVGLWALRRLLLLLGVEDGPVALTLVVVLAGTGLAYHAVMSPSMSHPYSFAAVSTFLLTSAQAWRGGSMRRVVWAAAAFALVLLSRPVNGLVLLALPVVALGAGTTFAAWWRGTGWPALAAAAAVFLPLMAIQPATWYAQSGEWLVRPYAGEGFLWSAPRVWKSLFGAQKGLFFHWPLLLFVFPGMAVLLRRAPRAALSLAVHFVALVYVTSAWWCWDYGDSYGPRPYLDHLAVFAVPMAFLFRSLRGMWLRAVVWPIALIVALQLFHSWQYTVGILHPHNMDREKWKAVFLRAGDAWRGALGGNYEPPPFAPCGLADVWDTRASAGHRTAYWQDGAPLTTYGGSPRYIVDGTRPFGPTLRLPPGMLPEERPIQVEASLRRLETAPRSGKDILVVCTLGPPEAPRVHYSFRMNDLPMERAGSWRRWRYAFRMPAARKDETLSFYIWQSGEGACLIDDLQVRVRAVAACPS